jgi:hypothetical protein
MGTMELKPNRSAPTVVISLPYTSNGRMRSQTTSGRRGKEANQNQNRVRRDESKTTSWGRTSFPTEAVEPEAGTEADDISQMLKGGEGEGGGGGGGGSDGRKEGKTAGFGKQVRKEGGELEGLISTITLSRSVNNQDVVRPYLV